MKYILLILITLFFYQGFAQNYSAQDMTLQLDENGMATLTPKDVLVNVTGTLFAIGPNDEILAFHYNQDTQSLDFIDETDNLCLFDTYNMAYDLNPINRKEYMSGILIDAGTLLSPFENINDCDMTDMIFSVDGTYNDCSFYFEPPLLFSFDREGILYETNYGSNGIFNFDVHSNIRTYFMESFVTIGQSGLTYDFENHRLIGTSILAGNNMTFYGADIETTALDILFQYEPSNGCIVSAIEYIGEDVLIAGSNINDCGEIFSVNLVSQEITMLASNYSAKDFLFIEDEIPDVTLSKSQFTCNDLGEQTIDITVIENGVPTNYQSTVNVVSDFSVRNCYVFRNLYTPDPNGSDAAVMEDFTNTIEVVSSCSSTFTITQDPAPGSLIPSGETVAILMTITDEFGNTAFCQTIGCSDSILSVEDQKLSDSDFMVYPNPANDRVTINNKNNIPLSYIEILDINGRRLDLKEINSETSDVSIELSSYSSGFYFVKITTENNSLIKRIIKQ